jgi:hypothetical protein
LYWRNISQKRISRRNLKVDTGCIVGLPKTLDYDIYWRHQEFHFGGEGLFYATLRGQEQLYIQSLPFSRLADRIIASAPELAETVVTKEFIRQIRFTQWRQTILSLINGFEIIYLNI